MISLDIGTAGIDTYVLLAVMGKEKILHLTWNYKFPKRKVGGVALYLTFRLVNSRTQNSKWDREDWTQTAESSHFPSPSSHALNTALCSVWQ